MPVIFKVFPSRYYDNCNILQMIENSLLRFYFLEKVSAYHKSTVTICHAFIDLLLLWEDFTIYNFISNFTNYQTASNYWNQITKSTNRLGGANFVLFETNVRVTIGKVSFVYHGSNSSIVNDNFFR